jgi:hemolysin III
MAGSLNWGKEPVSAWTHLAGFFATIVGMIFLMVESSHDSVKLAGMVIYGTTQASVFLASGCYHYFDIGKKGNLWLQKADHGTIYLLIAGSYVPPLLHFLDGAWRIWMLSVISVLAIAGVIMKLFWMDCPRWLNVSIYLGLGWIIVIPAHKIFPQMDAKLMGWFLSGGIIYTVGAFVYMFKRPDPWPEIFGHHEVWHIFVLGGAAAYFIFVFCLCDMARPVF